MDSLAVIVAARNEADRVGETVAALRDGVSRRGDLGRRRRLDRRHRRAGAGGGRPGGQPRPPARQGRERDRGGGGGAERRAGAAPGPPLRRRPRRLGGPAGAAGRGGAAGRVRPRGRGLLAPGRRWLRPRPRLRPLGDPAALRAETAAPISGQRALRAEALRATLPFAAGFGMEIGMTVDAVRAGYRLARVRARPRAPGDRADAGRLPPPRRAAAGLRQGLRLAALAW